MKLGGAALEGPAVVVAALALFDAAVCVEVGVGVAARYGFDSIHALASFGVVAADAAVPPVVTVVTLVPFGVGARVLVYVGAP